MIAVFNSRFFRRKFLPRNNAKRPVRIRKLPFFASRQPREMCTSTFPCNITPEEAANGPQSKWAEDQRCFAPGTIAGYAQGSSSFFSEREVQPCCIPSHAGIILPWAFLRNR